MATKINNYDAPLEVRKWRRRAELGIVHEVEDGAMYTAEVYTDGSKTGDSDGAAGKLVDQLQFELHRHCSNNQQSKLQF